MVKNSRRLSSSALSRASSPATKSTKWASTAARQHRFSWKIAECPKKTCCTKSAAGTSWHSTRSEEHTSELQSPYDLVCRLLLEKKKKKTKNTKIKTKTNRPNKIKADTESTHNLTSYQYR